MKSIEKIDTLLKKAKLKITPIRKLILEVFMEHSYGLTYGNIEKLIEDNLDKVTIYRTLKTYKEKGIIHQVLDTSNQMKYALCNDSCSDRYHYDAHIHFKCKVCQETYCIEDREIPQIMLPSGFNHDCSSMLIEGTCKQCNT